MIRPLVAIVLAGGVLAACASTPPAAPALLTYTGQNCAAAPDLTSAISLTPEKAKVEHVVNTPVGVATPCLTRTDHSTPYIVYALPADTEGKMVAIGGLMEQHRVFSPEIALLDSSGRVTRTFSATEFFYRGQVFSVQFRPRTEEDYVLVTSDRTRVGQVYDSIVTGMQVTPVPAGVATFMVRSGTEAGLQRTFSHDGQIQVSIYDPAAARR